MKIINGVYRITTFLKILSYDVLFRKSFSHGKISFRKRFSVLVEKGGKLTIGNGCFFNNDCSITCMYKIVIGDNTIFGEGVKIYDHNYHINSNNFIKLSGHTFGEVLIGENCWIGSNSVILKGAKIGNNSVIGAGCVIDKPICDNMLVTNDRSLLKEVQLRKNM